MNVFRMVLLTSLVVSVVVPVSSQNRVIWEGYVKPERIAVYESNSTESNVINTLELGDVVEVIFEVNASGTDWCRVVREGSQPLGFVLCLNLGKVPSVSKQSHRAAPEGSTGCGHETCRGTMNKFSRAHEQNILEMQKAGLPEQVLVAKIKSSQGHFDTSPVQLSRLSHPA